MPASCQLKATAPVADSSSGGSNGGAAASRGSKTTPSTVCGKSQLLPGNEKLARQLDTCPRQGGRGRDRGRHSNELCLKVVAEKPQLGQGLRLPTVSLIRCLCVCVNTNVCVCVLVCVAWVTKIHSKLCDYGAYE